jgi:plastocyanin
VLLVCAAACGGADDTAPAAPAPTPGRPVDATTAGSVTGLVRFEGTPPSAEMIRMTTDRMCVQDAGPNPVSDAILVAADGALRNAFVYLKDGLDAGYTFDTPTTPVPMDQKGCLYRPRVLGVRVGQAIEVTNSDPTMHNVHALPMVNREFNYSQKNSTVRVSEIFTAPEVMVRFKCDVHGWMAAWVGVVEHPYFAVTDDAGRFELKNVPPGSYTLEAWHEKFGRTTTQVTVAEQQAQTVAFAFTADPK